MKKASNLRKLSLNKETVRNLNADDLRRAAGGAVNYSIACLSLTSCTCTRVPTLSKFC